MKIFRKLYLKMLFSMMVKKNHSSSGSNSVNFYWESKIVPCFFLNRGLKVQEITEIPSGICVCMNIGKGDHLVPIAGIWVFAATLSMLTVFLDLKSLSYYPCLYSLLSFESPFPCCTDHWTLAKGFLPIFVLSCYSNWAYHEDRSAILWSYLVSRENRS